MASCESVRNMSKGSPFKPFHMCSLLQASSVAGFNHVIESQATPVSSCNPCRSSADQWQARKHPETSGMCSGPCRNSKYADHACKGLAPKKCIKASDNVVMLLMHSFAHAIASILLVQLEIAQYTSTCEIQVSDIMALHTFGADAHWKN